jgi:hypothetical protein
MVLTGALLPSIIGINQCKRCFRMWCDHSFALPDESVDGDGQSLGARVLGFQA